nr:glycosyltransferase 87 family protein [bacterium]
MKLRTANILLILAVVFHGVMLWNLTAHFAWQSGFPPRWLPQKTGTANPDHWAASHTGIGPFKHRIDPQREARWIDKKQQMVRSRSLMAVPPRMTDNFGLDFWVRDANNTDPGGDFFQLVRSGLDVRHGTSIYENYPPEMDPALKQYLNAAVPFHPPNRYPPGFAFTIGVILSLFRPWDAYLLWILIHELVLVFCIFRSRRLAEGSKARFRIAAAMWLAFLPWYLELYMGQTTFIIMAATLFLGLYLDDRDHGVHAGTWWALSLITKPISLLYAPVLVRKRRFAMLLIGLAVAVGSAAAYFVVRPDDGRLFLRWMSGEEMVYSLGNYGFQALLFRFHLDDQTPRYVALALVGIGLLRTFTNRKTHGIRLLSMWVAIYFLAYTHVWEHHQVLLLPAVIMPWLFTGKKRYIMIWFLAAMPSLFYLFNGHWNWTREVLYLTGASLPPLLLFFDSLIMKQTRALPGE